MTTTVVGAAVISDARVLAVRRTTPPSLAGRWEFPGGKLEAGESVAEAVRRELHEELGLVVTVSRELGRAPIDDERSLVLCLCAPVDGSAPRLGRDHDRLLWLRVADLASVTWLDTDRALLPVVRAALRSE